MRWRRTPLAVALGALGLSLVAAHGQAQRAEATALARLVAAATGSDVHVAPWAPVVLWDGPDGWVRGVEVTASCSAALVVGVLALAAAVLLLADRLRPGRILLAGAAAAGTVVAVNLGRMAAVAWAIDRSGSAGWRWAVHALAGSLVSLVAIAVGLAVLARGAFGGRRA